MTFQFVGAKAVPAHYFEFLMFQKSFVFHRLLCKAAYVYDCAYTSDTCLSHFTKGMVNYSLKKLPVPKNNLAAPWLFSRMLASCLTSLIAYEGKCSCFSFTAEHSL